MRRILDDIETKGKIYANQTLVKDVIINGNIDADNKARQSNMWTLKY